MPSTTGTQVEYCMVLCAGPQQSPPSQPQPQLLLKALHLPFAMVATLPAQEGAQAMLLLVLTGAPGLALVAGGVAAGVVLALVLELAWVLERVEVWSVVLVLTLVLALVLVLMACAWTCAAARRLATTATVMSRMVAEVHGAANTGIRLLQPTPAQKTDEQGHRKQSSTQCTAAQNSRECSRWFLAIVQ